MMNDNECWCESCKPNDWRTGSMRMIVCEICGNKRCPHATNHINECTGSNEPGQKGSSWENYKVPEMSNVRTAKIVQVIKLNIWVEKDICGSSHIMMQHGDGEYGKPFCYATFNYDYAFTSNSTMHTEVVDMMKRFGIEEKDIDWRSSKLPLPKWWHTPVYHVYMSYLWLKRKLSK